MSNSNTIARGREKARLNWARKLASELGQREKVKPSAFQCSLHLSGLAIQIAAMADSSLEHISQIGNQILRKPRLSKDFLVENLGRAANELSQVEQTSVAESAERSKEVETALKPLTESFIQHGLASHKDSDVRLLVTICAIEVFRIMAPEPPFEGSNLLAIFKLFISSFAELADMESPYFSKRVKILETFNRLGLCVIMLDNEFHSLIIEMFKVLFSVSREQHEWSLTKNILSILKLAIDEEASHELLEIILQNLLKEEKDTPSASSRLAASLIQMCCERLEQFVNQFLTSCMSEATMKGSTLGKSYQEIIYKIFISAPQMLFAVIPNIMHELLNNAVDIRRKAVQLLGRIFAVPEGHAADDYHRLFVEFLNRFIDKSMEVRISALQCVKGLYMANPSSSEVQQVLSELEARLLDFEDRVRIEAVTVICDIAMSDASFVTHRLVAGSTERLRDKSITVRKHALRKLMEVYQIYSSKCSEGCMIISDHWIHMFSLFEPPHLKALSLILSHKQRFQIELHKYLELRRKEKQENNSGETREKVRIIFKKLSASFPDSVKAEASFYKLDQLKDNYIFNALHQLLDELSVINAQNKRDEFLKRIGVKHPHFDFFSLISSECSFNIFGSEHLEHVLEYLSDDSAHRYWEGSAKILLVIAECSPSLLRGSEMKLCGVLEKNEQITHKFIEVLAKAGPRTPEIFTLTVLMMKDFFFVSRSFLGKTFKLLKEHAIPSEYACALALVTSAGKEDLKNESLKYLEEFIKEYSQEDQICRSSADQGFSIPDYPAYIVIYLVYVLAHDANFPSEDCVDEQTFADFCSPLFFLIQALVDAYSLKGDLDHVTRPFSSLVALFRAIRKAEDTVDAERTPMLHVLSEIGSSFTRLLKGGSIPLGRGTPDVILLPSAYYKAQTTKEFTEYSLREEFITGIFQTFSSSILEWQVISGQEERDPLLMVESTAASQSIPKHKKLSINQKRKRGECVLSSSNLVGEVSSLVMLQEKNQNEGRDNPYDKENFHAVSTVTADLSTYSRTKPYDLPCLEESHQNIQKENCGDLISSTESCLHLSCKDGSKNNTKKARALVEINKSPLRHNKEEANGLRGIISAKTQKACPTVRKKAKGKNRRNV
ncbi:hypothetical protein SAY87_014651 [Trapa incisa]|uniref:Sister chromatid cohesion protein PDS5 homolog A n=1 Tax=Trapa incisa TaxID=236973 RepID=A0AAN7GX53_9MYRT|nr:hypothetical protein SAY87_014651 [Trapa incisa]